MCQLEQCDWAGCSLVMPHESEKKNHRHFVKLQVWIHFMNEIEEVHPPSCAVDLVDKHRSYVC